MNKAMSYRIEQGHVRTRCGILANGEIELQFSCSDQSVPINCNLSHEELWENQMVEPVFSIRFCSVEQFEAYISIFNDGLQHAKEYIANQKE